MFYAGSYLAGDWCRSSVQGSVLGALLLGKQPEMLEEMNHQWQLWDCRLNELNAVCKQNKAAPCTEFSNKPTVICAF